MTPWQQFKERWGKGCGSLICSKAYKVVLARGSVPCDILFVGEAPGISEDTDGKPFVGPAGKLLDQIIDKVLPKESIGLEFPVDYRKHTIAFCNLVGCIPLGGEGRKVEGGPDLEIINQCAPRLREFVSICQSRLIVCVGKMAEQWLDPKLVGSIWELPPKEFDCGSGKKLYRIKDPGSAIRQVSIDHPAFILRANPVMQPSLVKNCIHILASAVENLCPR